jgi:hypothetical protein
MVIKEVCSKNISGSLFYKLPLNASFGRSYFYEINAIYKFTAINGFADCFTKSLPCNISYFYVVYC